MAEQFGCAIAGIDPSAAAIASANLIGGDFRKGTADALPFADSKFDVVIFGFCLYLADPADYFRIAAEADRVLTSDGLIVIKDFCSTHAYRLPYSHKDGVFSHKMEFSRLFLSHPAYSLLSRTYLEHSSPFTFDVDERISVDVLKRSSEGGF